MGNLACPSEPVKRTLRNAIEQEIKQFLDQGGTITVVKQPPSGSARLGGSLWHDSDGDLIEEEQVAIGAEV